MSIDHDREMLTRAAGNIATRFRGVFGPETIERYLHESYDLLAATSRIQTYVPLLAERFAVERLRALARSQGDVVTDTPEILYLCVHNAGRSIAAAVLTEHYGQGRVQVTSAGSAPGGEINPAMAAVLRERGLDPDQQFPKPLTDEAARGADVIVTMGCGDACPVYPGKRYLDWELTDPAGKPVEDVRPIVDQIDARVRSLLVELVPELELPVPVGPEGSRGAPL